MRDVIKLFSVLVFCFILDLSAAAVNVAIIGDEQNVDLVTAELSSDKNIELLERKTIDAVLKEHKLTLAGLSAEVLAGYFPHADVFAVFTPERLVVFNAKNGFRLMDGKPVEPAAAIRAAVAKTTHKGQLYLAIVSVRDVGVPNRMNTEMEKLTVIFEQTLLQSPAIQILERERLAQVVKEREITGKMFALTPSAKLITLEFEQGSEQGVVNLKVLIRTLDGKTLGKCEESDVFRDLPAAAASLQKKLYKVLEIKNTVSENAEKEAARFFAEYLASNDYDVRRRKLDAALVLDPMNEKYRYEEMDFDGRTWEHHIQRLEKCEAKFAAYRMDFPKVAQPSSYLISPERYENKFSKASKTQKLWLAAYCNRIRPMFEQELKKENPFDLSDGISSLSEMRNYETFLQRTAQNTMYWDFERASKARYENTIKMMNAWDTFAKQHPKYRNTAYERFFEVTPRWLEDWSPELLQRIFKQLESSEDFIAAADATELPGAHIGAAILRAQLKLLKTKSRDDMRKIYLSMWREIDAVEMKSGGTFGMLKYEGSQRTGSLSAFHFREINHACFGIGYPEDPVEEARLAYIRSKGATKDFPIGEFNILTDKWQAKNNRKYFDEVAARLPEIAALWPERLKNAKAAEPFRKLADQIFFHGTDMLDNKPVKTIIKALNPDFELTCTPWQDLRSANVRSKAACRAVLEHRGKLYILLAYQDSADTILLIEMESANTIRTICEIKDLQFIQSYMDDNGRTYFHMAAEEDRIAIAGGAKLVTVDIKTGIQRHLTDLWENWIPIGLAVTGNRIYLAAKKDQHNAGGFVMMESFDFDGGKRKIHFHSSRSEKNTPYDGVEKGMLQGFTMLPDGKIFFSLQKMKTEKAFNEVHTEYLKHLIFDPDKETFHEIKDTQAFPVPIKNTNITPDGKLRVASGFFNDRLTEFDPATEKAKIILAIQSRGKKILKRFTPEYDLTAFEMVVPPYLIHEGRLWSGGAISCVLDLSAPERSTPVLLPSFPRGIHVLDGCVFYCAENVLVVLKGKTPASVQRAAGQR